MRLNTVSASVVILILKIFPYSYHLFHLLFDESYRGKFIFNHPPNKSVKNMILPGLSAMDAVCPVPY